ncbi:Ubiquitin-conjugating enzyme E2-28.4 kDa [Giardia muris]|uniref:Ubiquitin-conjugating enzyme E2-28.4 kDa n=1 Tax=Giardia muris TaxID=5742 RepID=A0A4Z1T7Z8_GIAMU|nr:Ubiquitin-conjugating enzyme E2-28.4 kDa [Giardia muris]|eukprot:TNJ30223.1 Ubiquitin-conjugating enzyme E2-28.4 kDa [Giardia muris]
MPAAQNPQIIQRMITREIRHPDPEYRVYLPSADNLLEIHFSVRGPRNTSYEGGIYHGCIFLHPAFPYKPPHIQMLTPSGRFETHKNICFSFTAYHPETWSPACKLRDIIIGLASLFDVSSEHAIGLIDNPQRRVVEKCRVASRQYVCPTCGADHQTFDAVES